MRAIRLSPSRAAALAARTAEEASRVVHAYDVWPRCPSAGEPVCVRLRVPLEADVVGAEVVVDGDVIAFDVGTWTAVLPGRPAGTRVRYRIRLCHADGRRSWVDDAAPGLAFPSADVPWHRPRAVDFSYRVGVPSAPDWVGDAVVYHVLIDRFAGPVRRARDIPFLGHGGGTIAGLVERLDHVEALGADVLLVSAPFPAGMHVGYDATDLFAVDQRLGTVDDMRGLCRAAHDRGMRVLLDFEASYLGWQHSAPAGWFQQGANGERLGWYGGNPVLRPLDHSVAEVRAHLIDAARFWVDVGVDGFRLDSAHDASLDFWAEFASAVRGAFTVGEIVDDVGRWPGRVGGYFDFELCHAIRSFVAGARDGASQLDAVLRRPRPAGLVPFTFVENHDMDRVTFHVGRDALRGLLAHALLLTLPGTPVLYYGSEVGLTHRIPGDCAVVARLPMPWGREQDADTLARMTELVARRRSSAALRRGEYQTVEVDDRAKRLVFRRVLGDESVTVEVCAGRRPSCREQPPCA